ncbi:hypothetical protein FACS1894105_10160 [Clostridia bacterium]|nr:hypothetical protein FACS1894105_10160 [Clostridia bacterium]
MLAAAMIFSLGIFGMMSVSADDALNPDVNFTGIVPLASTIETVAELVNTPAAKETIGADDAKTPKLDLVAETIDYGGLVVEAFAIDGKWKAGEPSDKDIEKLLKKGGKITLTNKYDAKGKKPQVGAAEKAAVYNNDGEGPNTGAVNTDPGDNVNAATNVPTQTEDPTGESNQNNKKNPTVKTESVDAIPGGSTWNLTVKTQNSGKAPKFVVNYAISADDTNTTAGKWVLTKAKGAKVGLTADELGVLAVGYAGSGKDPVDLFDDNGDQFWGAFPDADGLSVKSTEVDAKPGNQLYYVKYAPYVDAGIAYAATPAQKIKVADQIKNPQIKVDYKKDLVKLKKGQSIAFKVGSNQVTTIKYDGTKGTGVDAKGIVSLTEVLDSSDATVISLWVRASEKKPSSATVVYEGDTKRPVTEENAALAPEKGKLKLDKTLEVYDTAKKKWGGLPKVTKSGTFDVRLKATKEAPAGTTKTLTITWGNWNQEDIDAGAQANPKVTVEPKKGITAATIA